MVGPSFSPKPVVGFLPVCLVHGSPNQGRNPDYQQIQRPEITALSGVPELVLYQLPVPRIDKDYRAEANAPFEIPNLEDKRPLVRLHLDDSAVSQVTGQKTQSDQHLRQLPEPKKICQEFTHPFQMKYCKCFRFR